MMNQSGFLMPLNTFFYQQILDLFTCELLPPLLFIGYSGSADPESMSNECASVLNKTNNELLKDVIINQH